MHAEAAPAAGQADMVAAQSDTARSSLPPARLPRLAAGERLMVALFLLSLPLVNPYLRGDGNGYYAYIRSFVIDGDLQFEDEYRRGDADFRHVSFRYADGHLRLPMNTATGHARNHWAMGSSLLWAPAFVQAHLAVRALDALGLRLEADGFSFPYRWACALATAFYTFIGLWLSYRLARRLLGAPFALAATLAVWLASPLPVYLYFLPFYAHGPSVFVMALFVWYWLDRRPLRTPRQWALLGALAALAFEVYHLNGIVFLLAAVEWLTLAFSQRGRPRRASLILLASRGAAFAVAAGVALLPHLAAKWVLHGSPFDTGRFNRFYWEAPRLWDVGFAAEHGLFSWTPLLALAVIGLVSLARRHPLAGFTLLGAFGTFYYVVASYERWHGVSGFGNRYFISLTPVFVLGLAALLADAHALLRAVLSRLAGKAASRVAWAALAVPLVLAALWNAGFVFQWGTGMVPRQGPVSLARVARNQFSAVPQTIGGYVLKYLRQREQFVREQERSPAR